MRTTVRLDDELVEQLRTRARQDNVSLSRALNRALRDGLRTAKKGESAKPRFRQETHAMGPARVNLDKALALAAVLEDEEVLRKLSLSK